MERIPKDCAPGCDHTLTAESFSSHWGQGWASRELVLSEAEKILPPYEQAKACMSRQGVHELYRFLKTFRWVSTASRPISVPRERGCEPFYPRLDDPEQERKLIMGDVEPGDESLDLNFSMPVSYLGLSTGQSIADPSDSNQEPNDTLPPTDDQLASNSNNGVFQNYEEQLSAIRSDFKKRISDLQSNLELDRDVAEIEVDSQRHREKDREKVEIHHHAVQAQKCTEQALEYAEKAQEHANTSVELAQLLMESMSSSNLSVGRSSGSDRPSSKRLREN
ncbi:hypothetical protein FAUST_9930 [Fusarium austroamericanum]|uniref:Uncharacterized protein n=1 Tax=Fusarium austroamericanum TaxID=282268 RepID=A0AAN5Z2L0_FUSAU|nr:hypothetical protein FAUST_9930 [Fusarium austroamericanum]